MATPTQQLMGMMSPQQARLLDDQLREKQIQQQAGGGMFSGAVAATLRGNDMLGNTFMGRQAGANELKNIQDRQELEEQKSKKTNVRARGVAELNNIIKSKIAAKELSVDKGRSLLRQAAQGIREPLEIIKEITQSAKWQNAGGNKLFRADTGEVKDTSTFKMPDYKTAQELAEDHTSESVEAYLETVTPDNPTGNSSLLVPLDKTRTNRTISASDKKAYDRRQQEMGVHNVRASKILDLANKLNTDADKMTSGLKADIETIAKGIFGTQDYESILRTQVEEMRAQVAISNLPPGVASDADVALVLRGTLPSSADAKTQARFLSGIAKIEKAKADSLQRMQLYVDSPANLDKSLIGYESYNLKRQAQETLDYISFNSHKFPPESVDAAIEVINKGDPVAIEKYRKSFIKHYGADFITAYMNSQKD